MLENVICLGAASKKVLLLGGGGRWGVQGPTTTFGQKIITAKLSLERGEGVNISVSNLFNYFFVSRDSKQIKNFPQKNGTSAITGEGVNGGGKLGS